MGQSDITVIWQREDDYIYVCFIVEEKILNIFQKVFCKSKTVLENKSY